MNRFWFAVIGVFFSVVAGCDFSKEISLVGRTMGTTYSVKIVASYFDDPEPIQQQIELRLKEINSSMSIFQADSEISRFNRSRATVPVEVSEDFMRVALVGREIYRHSQGAWDATVNPLVNLWGFGSQKQDRQVPPPEDIERIRGHVGYEKILFPSTGGRMLQKRDPEVALDFGSIAKGYGVDRIAAVIAANGYRNYLVEIGGEVAAAGVRLDGKQWRVGVNTPLATASSSDVYKVVALQGKALATSGDYRNFFEMNGRIYSHVIDPRTGYPVSNGVVSASIIAGSCALADGLATAVMVMGAQDGMALVEKLEDVEGLVVVRNAEGRLADYRSSGFFLAP